MLRIRHGDKRFQICATISPLPAKALKSLWRCKFITFSIVNSRHLPPLLQMVNSIASNVRLEKGALHSRSRLKLHAALNNSVFQVKNSHIFHFSHLPYFSVLLFSFFLHLFLFGNNCGSNVDCCCRWISPISPAS